jgi:hypothetical protein
VPNRNRNIREQEIDKAHIYKFKNNLDVLQYQKMTQEQKNEFYYDYKELERSLEMSPCYYVSKGAHPSAILFGQQESKFSGFWNVLDIRGSQVPTSRENAGIFIENWKGDDYVTIVGGAKSSVGVQHFAAFTFSLNKKTWQRVKFDRNIDQTTGSIPVAAVVNGKVSVY